MKPAEVDNDRESVHDPDTDQDSDRERTPPVRQVAEGHPTRARVNALLRYLPVLTGYIANSYVLCKPMWQQ